MWLSMLAVRSAWRMEEVRIPVEFEPGVFERWIEFSEEAKVMAERHMLNSRELFPGTERMTFFGAPYLCSACHV